ncbi:MAG TPA: cell division ATP-binding protein FtsE [Clostridia bacterium]|nr:cell division ATP-binding protein FtsE [Clostridia bacterium]
MLELKEVSMRYPTGNIGLGDVSIKIDKGEFVFLIGASGAGKSTFIKLLTKELSPTSGQLWFEDKNITKMHKRRIPHYRRKLGIVFQDYRLLEKETVAENVAFAMRIIGKKNREIQRTLPLILNLVGLKGKEKIFPDQLSGGEQQRVSIARAIANNPKLLICDEPTGNLDPATSWELMDLLSKLHTHGTTVIMATHSNDIVDAMQKRVIELRDGELFRDEQQGGYI